MRYRGEDVPLEKLREKLLKKSRLELGLCGIENGECHFLDTIEGEWACTKPPFMKECPLRIHL